MTTPHDIITSLEVGTLVTAGRHFISADSQSTIAVEKGMKGVVCMIYEQMCFDPGKGPGVMILFESGLCDGFSEEDLEYFNITSLNQKIDALTDYEFSSMIKLQDEFHQGLFTPAFN